MRLPATFFRVITVYSDLSVEIFERYTMVPHKLQIVLNSLSTGAAMAEWFVYLFTLTMAQVQLPSEARFMFETTVLGNRSSLITLGTRHLSWKWPGS